jgi:hypothetical protein
MKHRTWALGVILAAAGAAAAFDVPLRDGTVVAADSYKVTGSYVMITLAGGGQVAYDVADVNLEALRAAEAAAAARAGESAAAEAGPASVGEAISSGRGLKHADEVGAGADGLAITDRDVKHIGGSGVRGTEEQAAAEQAAAAGPEAGVQQGGRVVIDQLRVAPAGEGRWQVRGEVINRNPQPVLNVTVKLETIGGSTPWSGELQVASALGPDQSASFEHSFAAELAEGAAQPNLRAAVQWMQEETRRVPDYTKAGGVPHPSNLPLERGGVGGADLRPTPVQ